MANASAPSNTMAIDPRIILCITMTAVVIDGFVACCCCCWLRRCRSSPAIFSTVSSLTKQYYGALERYFSLIHSLTIPPMCPSSVAKQIEESISIADCFPPNRGVENFFPPNKSRSRFLFWFSSRQIENHSTHQNQTIHLITHHSSHHILSISTHLIIITPYYYNTFTLTPSS